MRAALGLVLAAALTVSLPARAAEDAYPPLTVPLAVERVAGSNVYYTLGQPGVPAQANEGHTSNAGFVVTPEGVVVFDALGTPSLGAALLDRIREVTDLPVRYVVVSHYHADHIYGLQAFKDRTPAIVIAQDKSTDYTNPNATEDEAAAPRLAQRREALAPWVNDGTRIIEPDLVFSQETTLFLGGKRFLVIYAGPAHSESDSMMLVEPDGVLFTGDIVQNGRIPFMSSAAVDTGRWLTALERVSTLEPRFIIPGHGRPSTDPGSAIAFTRDYILYLRKLMGEAVDSWTDFEAAYKAADWSRYAKLPAFDATNKGNAYRIYLDMENAAFAAGAPARQP